MSFASRRHPRPSGADPSPARRRRRGAVVSVESLEGKALLSGLGTLASRAPALLAAARGGDLAGIVGRFNVSQPERAAILANLRAGAGDEFLALVRSRPGQARSILNGFLSGRQASFVTEGLAGQAASFQPFYAGRRLDQLKPAAAGAVLVPGRGLVLAGMVDGPIEPFDFSIYSFGIDRGGAAPAGPFPGRPGLRYDAVVTVSSGPQGVAASVTDLRSGAQTPLPPGSVQVLGPIVKVTVDPAFLPSTGAPVGRYRVAFWTRSQPGGIETVGGFVPDATTFPVATLRGGGRRRG